MSPSPYQSELWSPPGTVGGLQRNWVDQAWPTGSSVVPRLSPAPAASAHCALARGVIGTVANDAE